MDFFAIFPFDLILTDNGSSNSNKIIRMVRVTRLVKVFDIARFNHQIKSFFVNDNSTDKIQMQYVIINIYKMVRLFFLAIIFSYFCGCLWYLVVD